MKDIIYGWILHASGEEIEGISWGKGSKHGIIGSSVGDGYNSDGEYEWNERQDNLHR